MNNNKKRSLFIVLVMTALLMPMKLWAQEPYAVLSDDHTTLTFYYDWNKESREGMSVGPFSYYTDRGWYYYRWYITTVIFDNSFSYCTTLTSTASWFDECYNLNTITGIENLNTSNVTDMSWMFQACNNLTSLDVSHFNTGNVTNMHQMFRGCCNLTSLDVSNFDTKNVMDMSYMFYYCNNLTSLDVSHFSTANVKNMSCMFGACKALTTLDISHFDTKKVTNMKWMFLGCENLTSLDVSGFKTENVTDMSYMFGQCYNLKSLNVSNFNTSNVTDMSRLFYDCEKLTSLDVSNFDTSKVSDMGGMFDGCKSLTSLDLSHFNTSNVTNMVDMFDRCYNLTSLDVTNFNTEKVTDMSGMFSGCFSLTRLDLSHFNTINVINMGNMFGSCSSLKSLNVKKFDTSKVTNMSWMFNDCEALASIDISNFDTSSVTNMYRMFSFCYNLRTIYCNDTWNVEVESSKMFYSCPNLVGGKGTRYDPNHVDASYAHLDGGPENPGYFTEKEENTCDLSDLPTSSAYYAATAFLCERGVLNGSKVDGKTNVNDPLHRAHLAKIAFRGLYSLNYGLVPVEVVSDHFPTVYDDIAVKTENNEYYYQAARALLYLEYGDGRTPFDRNRLAFEPDSTISRVNVLKALMETFNIKPDVEGTDNPFPGDANVVAMASKNPVRMGYVRKAAALGIITTENATFRPYDDCLRGEAFLMLARIMQKIEAGAIEDPSPQDSDYFQPLNTTLATIGLGVGLQMGNFQHYTKTSFALSGVVPLTFGHTYNSYNTTLPSVFYGDKSKTEEDDSYLPLGDGWSHSYHSFITVVGKYSSGTPDNGLRAVVHWGGGSIDVYKSENGKLVPESMGIFDEMTLNGTEVLIKSKSQIEYRFTKQGGTGAAVFYLSSIKDRNGNTLTINYQDGQNGNKRISSVSDGQRSLNFSYLSGTDLLNEVRDPLGRSIKFTYFDNIQTGKKQLKTFTDAEGNTTTYEYADLSKAGPSKLLRRIQLPKGNYIENQYDANHRLSKTESGINGVPTTKTSVSVVANYGGSNISTQSKITVERGSQTSSYDYTYNANNVVTGMTGAEGLFMNSQYGTGKHPELPIAMQNNSTDVSSITYDQKGNMTSITVSGDGTLTTTMTYDGMNNLTSVTDPKGNTTTYTYDSKGNMTGISAPEGVTSSITVNSKGLPTTVTNAMGVRTNFEYNSYGNLTRAILPALDLSSSATYDAASRMTSKTDALGRTSSFAYNNNDYVTSETDPMGHTTQYGYDANDNMTSITNAKGGVTTMTYDNATDWLLSVEFAGSRKQFSYNKDGTLKTYTKPDGTVLRYSYDALGRVTSDGVNSYSYDSNMRLSEVSDGNKSVSFDYDGFNRITGTSYNGHSNSYSYDRNGNRTSINGTTYGYDGLNRLTSVSFNGKTIRYTYRKDSRLDRVNYPNGMTTTYGYDAVGRLTSKQTKLSNGTVVAGYSYVLDKVGNILEQTTQEPYDDMALTSEDVSYSYNSGNRITRAGDITFSFDANGNTTRRGDEQYQWDRRDRLTRAGSTSIKYDPLGLIASYGDITFTTDPLGMGNVLSDSKGAEYIYGNGLEARVKNGIVSYYVTDVRGSVVAIVDDNGNITHKYQYDDFGKVTQKEEADYNPFQYVGKYGVMYLNDHQYYMRARHYDPTIGRFLSEDPIWSTNLYPYADNNPIMGIDPKGLQEVLNETVTENINNLKPIEDFVYKVIEYKEESGTDWDQWVIDNWVENSQYVEPTKETIIEEGSSLYNQIQELFNEYYQELLASGALWTTESVVLLCGTAGGLTYFSIRGLQGELINDGIWLIDHTPGSKWLTKKIQNSKLADGRVNRWLDKAANSSFGRWMINTFN